MENDGAPEVMELSHLLKQKRGEPLFSVCPILLSHHHLSQPLPGISYPMHPHANSIKVFALDARRDTTVRLFSSLACPPRPPMHHQRSSGQGREAAQEGHGSE